MRTRKNQPSTPEASSLPYVTRFAAITGVVTACAATLGGACGDPQPNTTGAGGTTGSSASAMGGMGQGGEDLMVVAGSVTIGSGTSTSSSSSGMPPPRCTITDPNGGATKFASAYGDAMVQTGAAVAVDKSGNIIVVGSFSGSLNLGTTTLSSAGSDDVFVAKFNTGGQLMWAKSFGNGEVQTGAGVGVDTAGNIYVTGSFKGSMNFGGGALNATGTLFADVFLAKLTSDGGHVWSQKFGDDNVQYGRGVAVDSAGNVILAGYFQNSINLGGATLTSAGLDDIYVAKFNTGGTHQWSRRFGDAAKDQRARAVALDAMGNVYLAGAVSGSIDLGGGPMTATADVSAFAAKLDSNGNPTWMKLSTGDAMSKGIANSIAVGPNGEVAVSGSFSGKFDLGGMPVSSVGVDDAFVTLFSAAGAHTYTKTFGDSELQTATGVVVAPNGELIVTGHFSGSIDLETGMPSMSEGLFDGFVTRLDSKGCPAWLRTYPGAGVHLVEGIALDPTTGGVALTGSFNGSADFGTGMTMASGNDVFLMSVNP